MDSVTPLSGKEIQKRSLWREIQRHICPAFLHVKWDQAIAAVLVYEDLRIRVYEAARAHSHLRGVVRDGFTPVRSDDAVDRGPIRRRELVVLTPIWGVAARVRIPLEIRSFLGSHSLLLEELPSVITEDIVYIRDTDIRRQALALTIGKVGQKPVALRSFGSYLAPLFSHFWMPKDLARQSMTSSVM